MRIIFCGSGSFAVPSFRWLLGSRHEVATVVTQPPRPAGRGGRLAPTNVAKVCAEAGLEALECPDVNASAVLSSLRPLHADVICVVDFGQMIREPFRQLARHGAFNLHGSLLPELRGAAPVNWAIIRGYRRTGVTTFSLVDRMDAGPIHLQADTEIAEGETAEELRVRLSRMGAELVPKTVEMLEAGRAQLQPQDDALATLARRLKKSDGRIDWRKDALAICNLIHGTWQWPGAQTVLQLAGGKDIRVTIARSKPADGEAPPGSVEKAGRVGCGSGRLEILQIKPAGRRLMAWRDFANGYRVAGGATFKLSDA